jgi:hypothetical protein
MKRTTPPAWLPDWRNAKLYPVKRSLADWRWQFLRRRLDYQQDFVAIETTEQMAFLIRSTKQIIKAVAKPAPAALARRYGAPVLLDPASAHAPEGYFPASPAFNVNADHAQIDSWHGMGFSVCRIDLAAPLDQQLRVLKALLKQEAKRRGIAPAGRREYAKWNLYLRVLDAYAAGAEPAAIISHLHELTAANQKAFTWHAAARKQQAILTGSSS